jgi:hypothetical protein
MRTFEAAAAGALLFQEAGNLEVPTYFADRRECVYYDSGNLEELLEYYLEHEEERERIARAGRERAREYTWGRMWQEIVEVIEGEWDGVVGWAERRTNEECRMKNVETKTAPVVEYVARVERLAREEEPELAIGEGRELLRRVEDGSILDGIDCGVGRREFDWFRVEWERAGWENAGNRQGEIAAKVALVRWLVHLLLGELTGDIEHMRQAVAERGDLPPGRAALGCALGRMGEPEAAVEHLREGVLDNPLDLNAARAQYQALLVSGDIAGCRAFAGERLLLAKAAPRTVPVEAWKLPVMLNVRLLGLPGKGSTRLCIRWGWAIGLYARGWRRAGMSWFGCRRARPVPRARYS